VGSCENGHEFVLGVAPFEAEVRFFDGERRFVALATSGDAKSPPCGGETYWPHLAACESPTIDRVECPVPQQPVPGDETPSRYRVDPSKLVLPGSALDPETGLLRRPAAASAPANATGRAP
jgi:hypothetical protein